MLVKRSSIFIADSRSRDPRVRTRSVEVKVRDDTLDRFWGRYSAYNIRSICREAGDGALLYTIGRYCYRNEGDECLMFAVDLAKLIRQKLLRRRGRSLYAVLC